MSRIHIFQASFCVYCYSQCHNVAPVVVQITKSNVYAYLSLCGGSNLAQYIVHGSSVQGFIHSWLTFTMLLQFLHQMLPDYKKNHTVFVESLVCAYPCMLYNSSSGLFRISHKKFIVNAQPLLKKYSFPLTLMTI